MTDEDIAIVDIDPVSWRNVGVLRDLLLPGRKTMTVIREGKKILSTYDGAHGTAVEIPDTAESSPELAGRLYREREGLDMVRVLERDALREFEKEISVPCRELDRDEYVYRARNLRRTKYADSLAEFPPYEEERHAFGYPRLKSFVENHDNSAVFIAAIEKDRMFFNLIFGIKNKKINLLTTWDAFGGEEFDRNYESAEGRVSGKFAPVSAGMFIDKEMLIRIFREDNREEIIRSALENGEIKGRIKEPSEAAALVGMSLFFWPPMFSTVYVNY